VDIEFRLVQKTRKVIQIHAIADNFYDHEGKPLATRGVFQDITDRKEAENALKKVEAQLIQSQKMESVGRLAGGVAHDYNNMLNIIMGHAEMAEEQLDPEDPIQENLAQILLAAERSADITRQLLAFARKQTIEPEILDLNASVAKMLKMLKRLIGEDIELSWIPGTDLGAVKVDKSQVDQVLANLCVNARDAIRGVGRITIETGNVTFDEAYCEDHGDCVVGEFVMLSVSDNGIGMTKDTLEKVFEPFFTTKGIGEGTGLGLATVYGIAKQNHGFVSVYSEPELGTAVKFYLPRQKASPSRMDEKHETELPEGMGETVLIVEDEPVILRLGRLILERQGYNVIEARSPLKALALAGEYRNEIDLLITDVVMPEMNGRELAEQLRMTRPRIKTLFMSGYTANVIAHRGVIEDGVSFMPKPFSRKDMAFKVREVLDGA
jgi:two-component system cell cycle sensor histidine kinase/response regulator CckA